MSDRAKLADFWAIRGGGFQTFVSRATTSHSAAVIAFLGARLGMTPNQLTWLSCLAGVAAFATACVLPTGRPAMSVLGIFVLAELVFVIDCADGILARGTNRATRFGGYLDHTLDLLSQSFGLGAIFAFAYRAEIASDDIERAHVALIGGFIFLVVLATRNHAVHLFHQTFGTEQARAGPAGLRAKAITVVKNLYVYQVSMLAMLLYLASPIASLAIFGLQATLLTVSIASHVARARRLGSDGPRHEAG